MFNLFKKKSFALYLADDSVRVLQLSGDTDSPKIEAIGLKNFKENSLKNGLIIDEKELAETVNELLKESFSRSIKSGDCVLVLPENQIFEFSFIIGSSIDPASENFKEILEEKIKSTIPIPSKDLNYVNLTCKSHGHLVVSVVAVKKSYVRNLTGFLNKSCGINVISAEPESISIARNLDLKDDNGKIVIYKIGKNLNWLILYNNFIFDSRTMLDIESFLGDLKKSISHFNDFMEKKIDQILILNSAKNENGLMEKLNGITLKIRFDGYKIDLNRINGVNKTDLTDFDFITGAALLNLNAGNFLKINLCGN